MKELLLKIRALLIRLAERGANRPLAPAAAVALHLLEAGDFYAAGPTLTPITEDAPADVPLDPADPLAAAGAACALRRKNEGGAVVAVVEENDRMYEAVSLAVKLNLPLVLLVSCHDSALDELSSRVMAADMECIPADGRGVMKLMPALQRHNVKLALENVYGTAYSDTHTSRAEDILPIIEAAGSEFVGACIDTGHANIFGLDIAQMARVYGKKLFALHVNGNAGKDEHVIPYTMSGWCEKMDYYAFSAALKEIGFTGYYNLEIACGDLPEGVAQPFLNYAAAVARALADLAE